MRIYVVPVEPLRHGIIIWTWYVWPEQCTFVSLTSKPSRTFANHTISRYSKPWTHRNHNEFLLCKYAPLIGSLTESGTVKIWMHLLISGDVLSHASHSASSHIAILMFFFCTAYIDIHDIQSMQMYTNWTSTETETLQLHRELHLSVRCGCAIVWRYALWTPWYALMLSPKIS